MENPKKPVTKPNQQPRIQRRRAAAAAGAKQSQPQGGGNELLKPVEAPQREGGQQLSEQPASAQNAVSFSPNVRRSKTTTALSIKEAATFMEETENSAVTPRDIKIKIIENAPGIQAQESQRSAQSAQINAFPGAGAAAAGGSMDPTKQALLDLKELFETKIATKWTGSRRQQYDQLEKWARASNLNRLERLQQVPCPANAALYRVVLSVPAVHTFKFDRAAEDGIRNKKNQNSTVLLRAVGTLFDQERGCFVGRSSTPCGIVMMARSPDKSSFGLKEDSHFELYFYATPEANYNIVFDVYLERKMAKGIDAILESVGWFFAPVKCLPAVAAQLKVVDRQSTKYTLLKGTARMLLNTKKESFSANQLGHVVALNSEKLSDRLQQDLAYLKNLVPASALFSDSDGIPGVHCPLGRQVGKRDQDSQLVLAIRGVSMYHLNLKETRPIHLIRMRVHYLNCNEKSLLRIVRARFQALADCDDYCNITVKQRRLNIRMNNSWVDLGPGHSVNLSAPVKINRPSRQILEACANIKLEQVLMDPMICLLFEIVLEVRIETSEAVFTENVTLASFPYMPRITMSRLYPVEVGDDYLLMSVAAELPKKPRDENGSLAHVLPLKGAEIVLEGIVSERDTILKQVEIREQERQYQAQLDKMRRNRRRELERMGMRSRGEAFADAMIQDDEEVVKVKIEQQKLLDQLDIARNKYVRFVQESEMLKFQTTNVKGMSYFDSIKRVVREGKIEVNSLKKRFRQNLKTLKALESGKPKGSLCAYEDSDEEFERLCKEAVESRIAEFQPQIGFSSQAMTRQDAACLLEEVHLAGVAEAQLTEPVDTEGILLHNEASDSSRINHLSFTLVKVEINGDQLTPWDVKTHLELEDFKCSEDEDQSFDVEFAFGTLARQVQPLTIIANQKGQLQENPCFEFRDIQCQLNRDLADYFKMFYAGAVNVSLSLKNGKTFACSQINVKQSLRQRQSHTLVAYEADILDSVLWQKIGKLTMLVKHEGQFVNPQLLARVNQEQEGSKPVTLKKVRARDPEWLKITKTTTASDEDQQELDAKNRRQLIVADKGESQADRALRVSLDDPDAEPIDDERKLRRIAAYKQRVNRQIAASQSYVMKVQPQKVCTHNRSRSNSRESSPASSLQNKRPMSASLVNHVRERCIQPQIVHMSEQKFLEQKREQLKPGALLNEASHGIFAGERLLDLRVGEPTFFFIVLENSNEKAPRTYTVTVSSATNSAVESLVKMITNMEELAYWQLYGRIDQTVEFQGQRSAVQYITADNIVQQCVLQNEIYVGGRETVAVPFLIRSYKSTGFIKDRIQIKATYNETKQQAVSPLKQALKPDSKQVVDNTHEEVHRFTVTQRYQPTIQLQAFEPLLIRDQNARQQSLTLIPQFKTLYAKLLRPNYLGDVSTAISRLYFKSNLGKITLSENQQALEFDPVEVDGDVPESQVHLLVYVYQMASINQQSTQNPFDLAHVLEFKLRLVAKETVEKIEDDRMLQRKIEASEDGDDMAEGMAEVDEMMELRDVLNDSRLNDISDLNLDGEGDKSQNKSLPALPVLEKGASEELLAKVTNSQRASHEKLPGVEAVVDTAKDDPDGEVQKDPIKVEVQEPVPQAENDKSKKPSIIEVPKPQAPTVNKEITTDAEEAKKRIEKPNESSANTATVVQKKSQEEEEKKELAPDKAKDKATAVAEKDKAQQPKANAPHPVIKPEVRSVEEGKIGGDDEAGDESSPSFNALQQQLTQTQTRPAARRAAIAKSDAEKPEKAKNQTQAADPTKQSVVKSDSLAAATAATESNKKTEMAKKVVDETKKKEAGTKAEESKQADEIGKSVKEDAKEEEEAKEREDGDSMQMPDELPQLGGGRRIAVKQQTMAKKD